MPLFNIKIDKVIITHNDELLEQILCKLNQLLEDPTGEKKQQIIDKLNKAIEDIKSTV